MFTKPQIFIIGVTGLIVLFFILIIFGFIPGLSPSFSTKQKQAVQLSFWGVENKENFQPIINGYQTAMAVNSNGATSVKITYTQIDGKNYEKELINALAAGQGPDILMFHNDWLPKHINKILPLPLTANFSLAQLENLFPQVVKNDFVNDGIIYALPVSIDTMAMIYNRDFFDRHKIATTFSTWTDFGNAIPYLTEKDSLGRITKSSAAIGSSEKSIDKASDLLSLLMMQSGAAMNESNSNMVISSSSVYSAVNFSRDKDALSALNFYLQFGDAKNSFYSWNNNFGYSLDSFANGGTAIIFNYYSSLASIKEKNPFLNLRVAPMLQFDINNPVNYPNYYGFAVSSQSRQAAWAWNFILYLTANPSVADRYIQIAKKPPALRALIQKYQNDPNLGVFSSQVLTAKSWHQKDNNAVQEIFSNMIDLIASNQADSQRALQQAEGAINGL